MPSSAFLPDGSLDHNRLDPEVVRTLNEAARLAMAAETRSFRIKTGHLLMALISLADRTPALAQAFRAGLCEGVTLNQLPKLLASYLSDTDHEQGFQLGREDFSVGVQQLLDHCGQVENTLGDTVWAANGGPVPLLPFCHSLFAHPDAEVAEVCEGLFNFDIAAEKLLAAIVPPPIEKPFDDSGRLRPEFSTRFDKDALETLRTACVCAAEAGLNQTGPLQVFTAMIEKPAGAVEKILRSHLAWNTGMQDVRDAVRCVMPPRGTHPPGTGDGQRECYSKSMQRIMQTAMGERPSRINDAALFAAMLREESDGVFGHCLKGGSLRLNLTALLRSAEDWGRLPTPEPDPVPKTGRMINLTTLAAQGKVARSVGQDALVEQMERALCRQKDANVLITGEPGVGKTTLVRELACRIANDEDGLLRGKQIIFVDADSVAPEASRDEFNKLAADILASKNLILCVDHFEKLLRHRSHIEGHNRDLIGARLRSGAVHLIGIIDDRHFAELVSADKNFADCFAIVTVEESSVDQSIHIMEEQTRPALEADYGVRIPPAVIARAVRVADQFILSERLPAKGIKVMREACERAAFRARKTGATGGMSEVTLDDVFQAAAGITQLDIETISASGASMDFEQVLSRSVVGQEEAVRAVANHLTVVKAGQGERGKPAGVYFFAGLTGVGKTELAQAIAEIYSASHSLQWFECARFMSDHSVTELIGVPPGYVGHERGGSIINKLNADPFSVFLFDEAEKAHPTVWDKLLTLFDQGWIEDTRGVRAYGNKAIFVFTSNAGASIISANTSLPLPDLKRKVRDQLLEVRNKNGHQPFSAEFFGRFTDILIFNPLSAEAFARIAFIKVRALEKQFLSGFEKTLEVAADLVTRISDQSYQDNEDAHGNLGARRVKHYIREWIQLPLTKLQLADVGAYGAAKHLRVRRAADGQPLAEIVG